MGIGVAGTVGAEAKVGAVGVSAGMLEGESGVSVGSNAARAGGSVAAGGVGVVAARVTAGGGPLGSVSVASPLQARTAPPTNDAEQISAANFAAKDRACIPVPA